VSGTSLRRSQVERYARKFAAAAAKNKMPAPTRELDRYLDSSPEDVFVALEAFVGRMAAGGPDDRLALGYLLLLQSQLERVRYRIDRGYEDASQLIERFQRNIADLAATGDVDGGALSMLASALHQAGIAASAELSAAIMQHAEGLMSDMIPNDPGPLIAELTKHCDDDPFMVVSMLAEAGHAMPAPVRALIATAQADSANAVAREAAILMLLDPEPAVRHAAAAGLQAAAQRLSPVSLRRLIAMRNWRPESERDGINAIIRASHAEGIDRAPWPPASADAILASCIDGSGAQGFMIVSPAGKRKRLSSVLLKNGVRHAWTAPPESQRQTRSTLEHATAETSLIAVSRAYFDRAVCRHLQAGLVAGTPPPAGLLQVAESIGGVDWQPEASDWRKILAAMYAELPAAVLAPGTIATLLRTSSAWARFDAITGSWFEDDQKVARLLGRPRGRQLVEATGYVLQQVLTRRRQKWAEHFLWTALWLREKPNEYTSLWRNFVILAQSLADGCDLSEVSLMRDIAARTVELSARA
jgi:hypothetical protein